MGPAEGWWSQGREGWGQTLGVNTAGVGNWVGIQGKRRSAEQVLTEEEVLVLVVVRQVLQLLLAILQHREEKAQAWVTTLTSKTRFSATLLYLLPGEF